MLSWNTWLDLIPFQIYPIVSGSSILNKQHAVTDTCTFLVATA